MPILELTILVPVLNEQECLLPFKEAMDQYLNVTPVLTEVLFIDDGSTDRSRAIIRQVCAEDRRYRYLSLTRNGGLSTALKAGFDRAETPWIGYIDADLQTTPLDFLFYFPHLNGHAIARRLPFFRGMHRFIPALVQLQGGSIRQVEVQHFERFAGTAKYHLWNRLVAPFFDTLAFVWMKKRYIRYQVAEQSPVLTTVAMSESVASL